ncbi:MAG: hypothetical protein KGL39_12995, partial [Patescibacteria group bacterium]|nr:hypothetical protein [Patescibacteria group bacterium]
MKQPTQPIAVRRSPVFVPGQGWVYTPGATMATSPPNITSTAAITTVLGVDPYERGFGTTPGNVAAVVGTTAFVNAWTVSLNLSPLTVPAGYLATLFPWHTFEQAQNGTTVSGNYYTANVISSQIAPQAYYNGTWQNGWKIPSGITVSAWRISVFEVIIEVFGVTGTP